MEITCNSRFPAAVARDTVVDKYCGHKVFTALRYSCFTPDVFEKNIFLIEKRYTWRTEKKKYQEGMVDLFFLNVRIVSAFKFECVQF